jgi:cytochrome c-type biogenesis protein CcmH
MVARYGNFVRLRPPFNALTFLLWACPALAVLAGATVALLARRRRPTPPTPLSAAERQKLTELLRS